LIAPPRRRRREERRRARWLLAGLLLALAAAFVLGIGLGEALQDTPETGKSQTLVRTLGPLPLVPITEETGTLSTSGP